MGLSGCDYKLRYVTLSWWFARRDAMAILSYSRDESIEFTDVITKVLDGVKFPRCFIERSGKIGMVRSRTGLTFITLMATGSTTSCPTLNWSSVGSMRDSTPWRGSHEVSCSRRENLLTNVPQNGMHRRKGWRGTQRTASRLGRNVCGIRLNARNAVVLSSRRIPTRPNSAISIAKWRHCVVAVGGLSGRSQNDKEFIRCAARGR